MAEWTIRAAYDPEAKVWYTLDCDMPGLITEGRTIERLLERAAAILPDLLELNAHLIDPKSLRGPHTLRAVAFHEAVLPIAA